MNGVKFYEAETRSDLDLPFKFTSKLISETIVNDTSSSSIPQLVTLLKFQDLCVEFPF